MAFPMRLLPKSGAARLIAGVVLLLVVLEGAPRLLGLTSFPIYTIDSELGYLPEPNQSGRFLNRNRWSFNDRSMATGVMWNKTLAPNLLLLGNSIVQGGNPIDQSERLGSVLQSSLTPHWQVWPIAVGGWSNVNQLRYLERFPDVAAASDFFVWEYMAGGLSELSLGRGEYVTPSRHPWLTSWYVTRRYLLPHVIDFGESELPPTGTPAPDNLALFEGMASRLAANSRYAVPGIIFLYPESERLARARQGQEWLPERTQIEALAARHHIMVIDIAAEPSWNDSLYRDGTHPTAQGNLVLGQILAHAVDLATRETSDAQHGGATPSFVLGARHQDAPNTTPQ